MAVSLVAALTCIVFHEMSHGLTAALLGDKTAKQMGRLSFNPLRHIDPVGILAFVFLGFGWAKPVQIDPRNFKNPKAGMALTALAGPVSNFILAAIFLFVLGVLLHYFGAAALVSEMTARIAYFSIVLGIFNLVPVPPLDGSKILFAVASDELWAKLMRYERYGFILLIILIMLPATGNLLSAASTTVFNWMLNITAFSNQLFSA
ncbi:site-2 protease family protein [Oscillospiraceae bacterium CM]|nr:site-2 protease family protein [Oscillospiraceae bacterium CM]